ncbi:hypothetical protein JMJ55_14420 [Belnapia sp. T6]|uniref:Glycosyltransferase RgtA/B/C/D-like domain-containing protein n=1 Tax=Belnapia mucosa TaxID=2804532 RepID=A0ABS1V4A5_9PROT|nr:hypothetical protein [Belnapia mucosa]MBL6456525.1 hypothetical protein [Belnapia mucosa]
MDDVTTRPWLRWMACLGALLVLLMPLFVTDMPPLLDYPNHLARTYLLAFGENDPVLSQIYAQHWDIIPNLAIDVILTGLVKVLPVYIAGRVMLGLILLLNYAAIILYSRSVFGRWSWWPVAGALMGYHALFLMGFMNFQVGIALAMLTAAGWNWGRERWPVATVIATAIAATLVFFCHIFGLVFCAVLIGSRELLAMAGRLERRDWSGLAMRALAVGLVFLPSALLYLNARLAGADDGKITWVSAWRKLANLAEPFVNYYAAFDKLTALAIFGLIIACLVLRRLRLHRPSILAAAICFLFYLAMPATLKEASFIDARFPVMLGMLLFAGTLPRLPRRPAQAVGFALAALFLVRMGIVASVWSGQQRDIADIRHSIAPVEPGARVLVATVDPETNPDFWRNHGRRLVIADFCRTDQHLGSLLTIERHAFWPGVFTHASQQPLRVLPPYEALSEPAGYLPDVQVLDMTVKPPRNIERPPYMTDWPEHFDYVLLLVAGGAQELPAWAADRLEPVNRTTMAALYRVRPATRLAAGHPQASR